MTARLTVSGLIVKLDRSKQPSLMPLEVGSLSELEIISVFSIALCK